MTKRTKPKKFGCVPDRYDKRDHKFKCGIRKYLAMPFTSVDWSKYFEPVKNQENEGTCVGFSTASTREFLNNLQIQHLTGLDLSERYIYEEAKKRDYWVGENYEGTSIRGAMKSLLHVGICEEKYWSYVPKQKGRPTKGYEDNALQYTIKEYKAIPLDWRSLRTALDIAPVVIGIDVPDELYQVKSDGMVKLNMNPESNGGHAMVLVGYDNKTHLFKIRNSWGKYWGTDGYCYFDYEMLQKVIFSAWQIYPKELEEWAD